MFDPKLYTGGDNVIYLTLAKSMATGQGYTDIYKPTQPAHNQYSIGLPLLLIPFYDNLILAKILIMLFGLGCLIFFYKLCKEIFKRDFWLVIAMFITTPILIFYNHYILTEIPFLFFVLGSLYFMSIYDRRGNTAPITGALLMAVGATIFKGTGLGLLAGLGLYLLMKKRYKWFAVSAIIGLVIILINGKTPYFTSLLARDPYNLSLGTVAVGDLFMRVWQNIAIYLSRVLPQALYSTMPAWLSGIYSFILTGILGYGGYRLFKKSKVLFCYLVPMVLILLLWQPVWSSDRFLIPLIPIFLIMIYSVIRYVRIERSLLVMLFVLVGMGFNISHYIIQSRQAVENNIAYIKGDECAGYPLEWQNYFETIKQLEKTDNDATVIARKPEYVYWLSGKKSDCYLMDYDIVKIQKHLQDYEYVIVDGFTWTGTTHKYLLPALSYNGFGNNYQIIYQTKEPKFYLLRRI
jgi:hypothetical protein